MIRFACPGCGATYTVPDEKGGKTGKCPKCQGQFLIPNAEPAPGGGTAPVPLPPVSSDPNAPVEIAPCPGCQARLSVNTSDLGADIECPYCKAIYKAERPNGQPPTPPEPAAPSKSLAAALGAMGSEKKSKSTRDSDEDDRGRAESEERPSRRRRRSREDEDEEYEEDRSSRRSRRSSRGSTVEVTRVGILSAGKVYMMIGVGFGLILSICVLAMMLFGFALGNGGNNPGAGAALLGFGFCYAIALPILYGVIFFITGIISAIIYNLAAGIVGGLEMDLE